MDKNDILKFYRLLRHTNQTELRAIIPKTDLKQFHFSTEKELLGICKDLDKKYNLYLGVNERKSKGSEAEDIISVGVIPIDIDCVSKPASRKDLQEAERVADKIIEDGKKQGFKSPPLAFSGNGFQIYFCIPKINIGKENRTAISEKLQEFQRRLQKKYSTAKVKLDNVGDLPRIMRIPGTYNLKSRSYSKFTQSKWKEDEKLKDNILDLTISASTSVGSLTEELKNKITDDATVSSLMEGDKGKFPSRSEAELSLVCKLIGLGLNKEQVFRVMASCKLGKWQEANLAYRELTYRKAVEVIKLTGDMPSDGLKTRERANYELIWEDDLDKYQEHNEWIIDKLVPNKSIGVWTGKRSTYKTFLVLKAAFSVSSGATFLGKPTKQGKVIYLDKENGLYTMRDRKRMVKAGMGLNEKQDVGFICFSTLKLDSTSDLKIIEGLIEKHKPTLLVIDTYRRAISFEENDAGAVSALFVDLLRPIADKYDLSIILIHHDRKGSGQGDEMDEIRGSSDLANYADFILKNERKGEKIILKQLKNRSAPEIEPIGIKIEASDEKIEFLPMELDLNTREEKCSQLLTDWIINKGVKTFTTAEAREVAFAEGIKKNNFHNGLSLLEERGIIQNKLKGIWDVVGLV